MKYFWRKIINNIEKKEKVRYFTTVTHFFEVTEVLSTSFWGGATPKKRLYVTNYTPVFLLKSPCNFTQISLQNYSIFGTERAV